MKCLSFLLLASATTFAASISQATLSPLSEVPAGWNYLGCYADNTRARALSSSFNLDAFGMSAATCISFCAGQGYPVAGVEYGKECWCGRNVPAASLTDMSSTCNMACSANRTQACGGSSRLSVYARPTTDVPVENPGPAGWESLGCYTDKARARALSVQGSRGRSTTVASCGSTCAGYQYFGVEYAGECFCGDSIGNNSVSVLDGCNMPCKGNSSEVCGGRNRLNVYQVSSLSTCAPRITTGGLITNGGFESGNLSPWTVEGINGMSGMIQGSAYEGCWAVALRPGRSDEFMRRVILTYARMPISSDRTLTFYAGRRSSAVATGSVTISVLTRSSGLSVFWPTYAVCSGSDCDLTGAGGSVWKKYTADIPSDTVRTDLQIMINWTGTTADDGSDDVLLDGLLLTQPLIDLSSSPVDIPT